jgi:hypothetical protein
MSLRSELTCEVVPKDCTWQLAAELLLTNDNTWQGALLHNSCGVLIIIALISSTLHAEVSNPTRQTTNKERNKQQKWAAARPVPKIRRSPLNPHPNSAQHSPFVTELRGPRNIR